DEITSIKQKIAAAKAPGSDRAAIQADIDKAISNIATFTGNASFNGTNLVNNDDVFKVLGSVSRDADGVATPNYIDVPGKNLNIDNGGGLSALKDLKVTRDALVSGSASPQSKIVLGAAATADGTLKLDYRTASGEAKSVTLNVANGAPKA